jgi:hypothetical protein
MERLGEIVIGAMALSLLLMTATVWLVHRRAA